MWFLSAFSLREFILKEEDYLDFPAVGREILL
jgi:hypothetical protein